MQACRHMNAGNGHPLSPWPILLPIPVSVSTLDVHPLSHVPFCIPVSVSYLPLRPLLRSAPVSVSPRPSPPIALFSFPSSLLHVLPSIVIGLIGRFHVMNKHVSPSIVIGPIGPAFRCEIMLSLPPKVDSYKFEFLICIRTHTHTSAHTLQHTHTHTLSTFPTVRAQVHTE